MITRSSTSTILTIASDANEDTRKRSVTDARQDGCSKRWNGTNGKARTRMRPIDADALKKNLPKERAVKEVIMQVASYSSDYPKAPIYVADLVRCKECKYYDKFPTWSACTYWSGDPYEQASVNPNDFCSYGEREGE